MTEASALILSSGNPLWQPVSLPELGEHQVRVQSRFTGIRHADEMKFIQKHPDANLPFPPTWGCGEIVEKGRNVNTFQIGACVVAPLLHQTVQDVDSGSVFSIGNMKPEFSIFIDAGITALHALRILRLHYGDQIAVTGLGAVGLMAVQYAQLCGAVSVAALDPDAARLHTARRLGAHITQDCPERTSLPNRLQKVLECSGTDEGLLAAAAITAPFGSIVLCGNQYSSTALQAAQKGCDEGLLSLFSLPKAEEMDLARRTVKSLQTKHAIVWPVPYSLFHFQEAPAIYQTLRQKPNQWVKVGLSYIEQ